MSISWHEGEGLMFPEERRRALGEGHCSFLSAPSQSSTSGEGEENLVQTLNKVVWKVKKACLFPFFGTL